MKLLVFLILLAILFVMFPAKVLAAIILITSGFLSLVILVFVLIACLLG
jgi:hypothetical protein